MAKCKVGFQTRSKCLWAGIVAALTFLCIFMGMAWHPKAAGAQTIPVEGTELYSAVQRSLQLINEYRAEYDSEPLQLDSGLTEIAMVRAQELFILASHERPVGGYFDKQVKSTGAVGISYMGENIAMTSYETKASADVARSGFVLFKNSPPHAANMRDSGFTHIGIGIVRVDGYGTDYCYVFSNGPISGKTTIGTSDCKVVREIEVAGQYASLSLVYVSGSGSLKCGDSGSLLVRSGVYNGRMEQKASVPVSKVTFSTSNPDILQVSSAGKYKAVGSGTVTVTATLPNGISGSRTVSIAKTTQTKSLQKPTVTGASNVSKGIKVTWKDSSSAKGYYVLRKTGNGKWTKIATVKSGTRSYVDKKAKNGTRYSYTVQSYSGKIKSSYDTMGKTAYRLTNIKISSAKYKKSCKVLVRWGKNSKATGYQIQYSTNKNFSGAKTLTVKGASKTSYTISKLSKNTTYYVRVRAYYSKGSMKSYTSWSGSKSVKETK